MDSSNKAAPNINTLSFPTCIWAYLTYFIFRAALSCRALECRGGSAAAPPSLLGLLCLADKLRINSPFDFIPEKSQLLRGKAELEGLPGLGPAQSAPRGARGIPAAPCFHWEHYGKAGAQQSEGQSPCSLSRARAPGVTQRSLPKASAAAGWKTPPVLPRNYRHTGEKELAKGTQGDSQGSLGMAVGLGRAELPTGSRESPRDAGLGWSCSSRSSTDPSPAQPRPCPGAAQAVHRCSPGVPQVLPMPPPARGSSSAAAVQQQQGSVHL